MSLEDAGQVPTGNAPAGPGTAGEGAEVAEAARIATLRAWAHPLRLQMLSLLTGAAMSAAELARELGVSQALASYHLRTLADSGVVELAEERVHRGGRERRYRYRVPSASSRWKPGDPAEQVLFVEAMAAELRRRGAHRAEATRGLAVDAELWVSQEDWDEANRAIAEAAIRLHERAQRPRSEGTVRTSATLVMFTMTPDAPARPEPASPAPAWAEPDSGPEDDR
jgi:DNA-binding transcriptional ArsR family regulator